MAECVSPRSAERMFAQFFGASEPSRSENVSRRSGDDIFSEFFGSSNYSPKKGAAIERTLPCNLEELYNGTTRKMKISRDILLANGKQSSIEEILTVEIKRGWKKGTKITFAEKGNQRPGIIPPDLIFIIDEKPHKVFKRDGDDLIVTRKISLAEALTGNTIHLTTLDGRHLTVPINAIVTPGFEKVLIGEGMPISKNLTKRGNLRIVFDVKFPSELNSEQKSLIRRAFPSS